jgi:hypothetical protein
LAVTSIIAAKKYTSHKYAIRQKRIHKGGNN